MLINSQQMKIRAKVDIHPIIINYKRMLSEGKGKEEDLNLPKLHLKFRFKTYLDLYPGIPLSKDIKFASKKVLSEEITI